MMPKICYICCFIVISFVSNLAFANKDSRVDDRIQGSQPQSFVKDSWSTQANNEQKSYNNNNNSNEINSSSPGFESNSGYGNSGDIDAQNRLQKHNNAHNSYQLHAEEGDDTSTTVDQTDTKFSNNQTKTTDNQQREVVNQGNRSSINERDEINSPVVRNKQSNTAGNNTQSLPKQSIKRTYGDHIEDDSMNKPRAKQNKSYNDMKQSKDSESSYKNNSNINQSEDIDSGIDENDLQASSNKNNKKKSIKTLLQDDETGQVDDMTKVDLLKQEVQSLSKELTRLNSQVKSLQDENNELKTNLIKQNEDEKIKIQQEEAFKELSKDARAMKAESSIDVSDMPPEYVSAENLLIVGSIDLATQQFKQFISTNNKPEDGPNETTYPDKKAKNKDNLFKANANYWLGRISNINQKYKEAVGYFSESYKLTNYNNISLLSLIGLIESLTRLKEYGSACTAIKQFKEDYLKATAVKTFTFNPSYMTLVDKYTSINKCS